MRICIVAAALAALASCASSASSTVSTLGLAPGQGVMLAVEENGAVHELARTNSPSVPSDTERSVMDGLRDNPAAMGPNAIPMIGTSDSVSEPIEANRIRIRFLIVPPHDSMLMIENGYDQAFTYRASILANDDMRPTDVCLVLPSRHGVEHWPYLIDRIELSGLALQPWREGDPVVCR